MKKTKNSDLASDGTFLARAYAFERNRLLQIVVGPHDGYALPACWRPCAPVWRKLAAAAKTQGVDPVRYVRWCLELGQVGRGLDAPEPNRLLERRRMDAYRVASAEVRRGISVQFTVEKATARRHLNVRQSVYEESPEFALMYVLADDSLGLSPLYRYLLALTAGTPKLKILAGRLKRDAKFQFSKDAEENMAVYGAAGRLPAGFADDAARLYARVVDRHAALASKGVRQ